MKKLLPVYFILFLLLTAAASRAVQLGGADSTYPEKVPGTFEVSGQTTFNSQSYTWPSLQGETNTFLKNTGSGVLTWEGVSVTPGGDSGAVQFNAGGSLSGEATNFFFDSTNKRLGIGTGAPTATLEVAGDLLLTGSGDSSVGGNLSIGSAGASIEASTGKYYGDGSELANVRPSGAAGGSLSGTYPNPSIAAGAVATAEIASGAVTGPKLASSVAGSFSISTTGKITAEAFYGSGAGLTNVPATPAGNTGAVQFNSSGVMSGEANNLFYNVSDKRLGIGTSSPNNLLQVRDLITFDDSKQTTFIGFESGKYDNSGSSSNNTGIGYHALSKNSITGQYNTALGGRALRYMESGSSNTAVGYSALYQNTSGNVNTALGSNALSKNQTSSHNTAVGTAALYQLQSGDGYNTALGSSALYGPSSESASGSHNTAVGFQAIMRNDDGSYNTAIGLEALKGNTSGSYNTAAGLRALGSVSTGNYNVAYGALALQSSTGSANLGIGYNAGSSVTSGQNNTLLGYNAASNLTTGTQNLVVGYDIEVPQASGNYQLNIGNLIFGTGVDGTGSTISSGNVGIAAKNPGAKLEISTATASTKGLIVKASGSQAADLTEWQNSSGTIISSVDASGNFRFGSGASTEASTGKIWASTFYGSGAGLTGIAPSGTAGGSLSGTYPNPSIAAGAVATAEIASGAVTGPKLASSVAGSFNISTTGSITAEAFYGDGSNLTGISVSPGAPDSSIQFNSGSAFAGDANLTWNNTTKKLAASTLEVVSKFKLPQAASATAEGELYWDADNNRLMGHDGTNKIALGAAVKSRSIVIKQPDTSDDFAFWRTPDNIVIVKVTAICSGETNVVGQLQNYDSSVSSPSDINSSDWTITTSLFSSTSFSSPSIPADNWVGWKTTSRAGTVEFLTVSFDYYEN